MIAAAAAACKAVVALVDHAGLGVQIASAVGLPSFVVVLAAACGAAAVLVHLACADHILPALV